MSSGLENYKSLIDSLVKMSGSCAAMTSIKRGEVKGVEAKSGINDILAKLSDEERDVLANYTLKAYTSGIYDTLEELEWHRVCKDMVITMEGEELPVGKFEGIPCDYIGRCDGWEWPE